MCHKSILTAPLLAFERTVDKRARARTGEKTVVFPLVSLITLVHLHLAEGSAAFTSILTILAVLLPIYS